MMATRMLDMVKGVGYATIGGVKPTEDDDKLFAMASRAERSIRTSVKNSMERPNEVIKSFNSDFMQQFGMFLQNSPANAAMSQFADQISSALSAELGKNFTLTAPLSTGLVPFDLLAPSRLIYPVYSPMRNKLPRTPGQGSSRRAKIFTGVSGSRTGGGTTGNAKRWSISELPTGQTIGSNWPTSLPGAGAQAAVDISIPYQFFGLSESLSWLAQFGGQGFEDVSALANLILLQEAMIAEEDAIFSGTSASVLPPGVPTLAARAAGSTETALSGVTTNVWVRVSARNYYGESPVSTTASVAWSSTDVVDVTIVPSKGAFTYNIYVGTGASDPGTTGSYLMATGVGGAKFTLQGALPTTTATAPTTDSGTYSATDYEGLLSIIDGHASVDTTVYPAGFSGVGVNKSAGTILNVATMFTVLEKMWSTGTTVSGNLGAYRANPSELIAEGTDVARLANDMLTNGTDASAYRLFISQDEVAGIRAGAAVSEFQNPITRAVVKILVHPWLPQGTAFVMSYTLPMSWTNTPNCWEMVMVQDLLSISWPVIDPTFRYSIFEYGNLTGYGPQYSSVIQGLQQSASTPYS